MSTLRQIPRHPVMAGGKSDNPTYPPLYQNTLHEPQSLAIGPVSGSFPGGPYGTLHLMNNYFLSFTELQNSYLVLTHLIKIVVCTSIKCIRAASYTRNFDVFVLRVMPPCSHCQHSTRVMDTDAFVSSCADKGLN